MRYLTKSRFKMAVECPRKLYYSGKAEYGNTKQEDTFLQALADGGFQVGELAKRLYPEGIEVSAKGNAEALAETAGLLKHDTVTLFEPAIAYGSLLVRADVLIKKGNSLKIVEVKSKSFRSDDPQIVGKKGLKACAGIIFTEIKSSPGNGLNITFVLSFYYCRRNAERSHFCNAKMSHQKRRALCSSP